jgi:acetyl esterase
VALDPQVKTLLEQMNESGMPALSAGSPDDARQVMTAFREMAGPPEDVASVEDRTVPGPAGDIPVRIYRPAGDGLQPVLVFFHGGGWVIGNIDTHDVVCRMLANRAGATVVSVDYRLAPEAPFPAAVDDCVAATKWVAANGSALKIDPARLAVGGDSAGGNLAAVVALAARDAGGPPIAFQLLIYPATDMRMTTPSIAENGDGYFLTAVDMKWFYGHYAANVTDWRASPLLAGDHANLPPAFVLTAEYDPLRDEGEAYAEALRTAGGSVTVKRYDGLIHGFFSMSSLIDAAEAAVDDAGAALRANLAAR